MNEANEFYESVRTKRQSVLSWRDGSGTTDGQSNVGGGAETESQSGKGELKDGTSSTGTKDGTASHTSMGMDQTPNG